MESSGATHENSQLEVLRALILMILTTTTTFSFSCTQTSWAPIPKPPHLFPSILYLLRRWYYIGFSCHTSNIHKFKSLVSVYACPKPTSWISAPSKRYQTWTPSSTWLERLGARTATLHALLVTRPKSRFAAFPISWTRPFGHLRWRWRLVLILSHEAATRGDKRQELIPRYSVIETSAISHNLSCGKGRFHPMQVLRGKSLIHTEIK